MITLMLTLLSVGLSVYWFLKWSARQYALFEKQGLKYDNSWIIPGDPVKRIIRLYSIYPTEKVVGVFEFLQPGYLLRSPKLIKQLTIKDFSYFQDRISFANPKIDEIFGNTLFSMKGKQWRDMRSTLSPLFAGSKMRLMFDLIIKCAE